MSSVVTNHWSYLYRRILELKRNDIDGTKMRDKCSEEFPHVTGIRGIWEEIIDQSIFHEFYVQLLMEQFLESK